MANKKDAPKMPMTNSQMNSDKGPMDMHISMHKGPTSVKTGGGGKKK